MKQPLRNLSATILALLMLSFLTGCSSKGVHMPKHRKRRNCDCPTFSMNTPTLQTANYGDGRC